MTDNNSVTWWIDALKEGDEDAAHALWHRYFQRLVGLARQRLHDNQRRVSDEEDVAIDAFKSLCEGAERGDYQDLRDREELWRLLATITARKAGQLIRHHSREKRGAGKVRGDSLFGEHNGEAKPGFDGLPGDEPTPDFLYQLVEERERMLSQLQNGELQKIAQWKLDGWDTEEIASKLGMTRRSVQRKMERIRIAWKSELSA